jgi:hypothetical protein
MANYTPINNFAAKDSLPPGDPLKRAKGTDVQDELNAIAAAIATKVGTDPVDGDNVIDGGTY